MRPPQIVLEAFGLMAPKVEQLEGGQGITYRAGHVVLKPAFGLEEAIWVAQVYSTIEQVGFRVPRPIATDQGNWVCDGWTAWEYLEGTTAVERYAQRLEASRAFHRALATYPRPAFFDRREDAWSQADRIVWEGAAWQPHPKVAKVYAQLESYTLPLDLPEQAMHGDIAGNMLYAEGEPLAIIDFSPYWRPAAYAEALMVVDSILWEGAPWTILQLTDSSDAFMQFEGSRTFMQLEGSQTFMQLEGSRTFMQLVVRAAMRRLAEADRHYQLKGLAEEYLEQVGRYADFSAKLGSYL